MMDGKASLQQQSEAERGKWSAFELKLFVAATISVFAGTLFLYGFGYSVHQDLAGGALSGRLAYILGDAYSNYSIYFPPVEKLWFQIAAFLSDLTGLQLDLVVVATSNIMVLLSTVLAYHIRRITVGASPPFFIFSTLILIVLPILFKNVFGLREHLVVLGLWPYLVLRFSDPDGDLVNRRLRILVGLWMGVTLLFKYLYSAVVILVELAEALMKRRLNLLFRIENITAGSIVFLYLLTWLGIDPFQREVIGTMLNAIDANLIDRSANLFKLMENAIPAVLLLIASLYFRVPKRSTGLALAVVVATLFTAWLQERWYSHHLFPITMAYIGWWAITAQKFRWYITAALALLVMWPISVHFLKTLPYQWEVAELEQAFENDGRSLAEKRVAILTMHPSPYNQYIASNNAWRWNLMMNNAYVSAELKPFDKKDSIGKPPPVKLDHPGRSMLHDQMLRLWEDMPPDALIVDRTHNWPLKHIDVDWLHVFSNDSRFQAFHKNYRPVMVHEGKHIQFTYYVRIH